MFRMGRGILTVFIYLCGDSSSVDKYHGLKEHCTVIFQIVFDFQYREASGIVFNSYNSNSHKTYSIHDKL